MQHIAVCSRMHNCSLRTAVCLSRNFLTDFFHLLLTLACFTVTNVPPRPVQNHVTRSDLKAKSSMRFAHFSISSKVISATIHLTCDIILLFFLSYNFETYFFIKLID